MARRGALALISTAIFVLAACSSSGANSSPSVAAGSGTTSERLWNIAAFWAKRAEAKAIDARAVRATDRRALTLILGREPDESDVADKAVWLLEVHGDIQFSCECGVTAGRDGHSDGRYMELLVDSPSLKAFGPYLLTDPLPLERLGSVIHR
jgi:hypothetical protein